MSAHVLLNLLNELGKRDKMRGLLSILSLFRDEFNKFNNTGVRMLDYIYHTTLTLILFHIFRVKTGVTIKMNKQQKNPHLRIDSNLRHLSHKIHINEILEISILPNESKIHS